MVEATRVVDVGRVVKELKTIQLDPGLTIKTAGLAVTSQPTCPTCHEASPQQKEHKDCLSWRGKARQTWDCQTSCDSSSGPYWWGSHHHHIFLLYDWEEKGLYLFTMVNIFKLVIWCNHCSRSTRIVVSTSTVVVGTCTCTVLLHNIRHMRHSSIATLIG
jgi:hypothetical protein